MWICGYLSQTLFQTALKRIIYIFELIFSRSYPQTDAWYATKKDTTPQSMSQFNKFEQTTMRSF